MTGVDVRLERRPAVRPATWLVVVALAHALLPLVLLGLRWPFGADETVYLSQFNGHVPALYFSAPRARGPALIAAPVTMLTSSVAAVRVWVTVLSGVGLWGAFRPWLTLVRGWVVPAAAAAFATLWTVMLYGPEVMPNEWVAFATLGAAGLLLRWLAEPRPRHLIGVVLAMAVIGLLRPSDAGYAVVGLAVPTMVTRRALRVRGLALGALALGLVLGVAEWVVEAETTFGGVVARVHAAQAEQGGGGVFWAGAAQARALAGPLLCRTGCHADAAATYRLWWIVAGVLVVVALAHGVRCRSAVVVLPVFCGVVVAIQYLFTVPYAAPRFLLPTYALLSIPAVIGAQRVVGQLRRQHVRRLAGAVLVGACLANAAVQYDVLSRLRHDTYASADRTAAQVGALRRAGVRGPCLIGGHPSNDLPLSYALACTNAPLANARLRAASTSGQHVIWFGSSRLARVRGVRWQRVLLPRSSGAVWLSRNRGSRGGSAVVHDPFLRHDGP